MCNFYFMFYTDYSTLASRAMLDLTCMDNLLPALAKHLPAESNDPPPPNPELEAQAHGHHHHSMGGSADDDDDVTKEDAADADAHEEDAEPSGVRFPGRHIEWSRSEDRFSPPDYFDYSNLFEPDAYYDEPLSDRTSYNYYNRVQNQRSRSRRPLDVFAPPSRSRFRAPGPVREPALDRPNRPPYMYEPDADMTSAKVRLNEPQRITVAAGRSAMNRKPVLASASEARMVKASKSESRERVLGWGELLACSVRSEVSRCDCSTQNVVVFCLIHYCVRRPKQAAAAYIMVHVIAALSHLGVARSFVVGRLAARD